MSVGKVNSTGTPQYKKIRLLSLICAIAVMYIHAENWSQFGFSESTAGYALQWKLIGLCSFAVPFFFTVSAYLFFRDFSWNRLLPKWKHRIFSLVVPYLLWNTIYFVYLALLSRVPLLRRS